MKATITLIAALMLTLLTGCYSVQVNIDSDIVHGSGNIITEERPVSNFAEVVVANPGNLTIEQNGTESLTIEGDDNILPLIVTEVKGNRLTIRTKTGSSYLASTTLNYRLSVKSLTYIATTSTGNVAMGKLDGGDVMAETTSTGSIRIEQLSAPRYVVKVTSSGDIITSGKVDEQEATLSSSGDYDGSKLESKSAVVTVSSSGSATVAVSDSLNATVSSSGSILYIGSPALTQNDSSSGSITQIGK